MIRLLSGSLLVFSVTSVSADSVNDPLSGLDSLVNGEIPTVVTPAKVAQPRVEVSSTISVLSGEFIRQSNIQYVEDLLFYVPGFFVGPYMNSYQRVVAYHGTELDRYRRIQVLVNGRSVYSSAYARVDWSSLAVNVEDVERIEVNRGPNAATYGSNSFLAVINIITRSPLDTLGMTSSVMSDNKGNRRLYGQYSGLSDNWSYRASASKGTTAGYEVDEFGRERNDGHTRSTGNMYMVYDDTKQKVDIDIGASQLDANVEKIELAGVYYDGTAPYLDYGREHAKIGWEFEQSPTHTLKAQYYYDHSNQLDVDDVVIYGQVLNLLFAQDVDPTGLFEGSIVADLEETRHDLELQSIWTPSTDYRLVNTVSYRQDYANSKTYFNGDYTEELLRASTNLSYRALDPVIVNGGVMVEHSKLTGQYTSPQLGATYKFSEQSSARVNVSQAYRTPDLYDENAEWSFVFNDIRSIPAYATGGTAEQITSYEVGFFHNIPTLGLSYDISTYLEQLSNVAPSGKKYDKAIRDGGVLTRSELYEATIHGVEVELDWHSAEGTLVRATAAYQDTESNKADLDETVAPFVTTLFVSQPLTDRVSVNTRYIYGKEIAQYDYEFLSLWLSYRLVNDGNTFTAGIGGSTRLDDSSYIYVDNYSSDKTSYFLYGSLSF